MRILLCGGGTGGHIMPILAIADEIKRQEPSSHIIYVGGKGGKFAHLTENHGAIDEIRTVYPSKFRRYHNESWLKRIFDFRNNFLNARDVFYLLIGYCQSVLIIRKTKPDIILIKGGHVGLPVGLAAISLRKRFITHDSDAIPSLTSKILAKKAYYNAIGVKTGAYPYPGHKKRFVGVPISSEYAFVTSDTQREYKDKINIPQESDLLLITGGSLGAISINSSFVKIVKQLLDHNNNLFIIHQVGKNNQSIYNGFTHPRLRVEQFLSELYKYSGAADIVISRGGATTITELAVQGKAVIMIPNPQLTGGHQTKNAEILSKKQAVIVISEKKLSEDPNLLADAVIGLIKNKDQRTSLSTNLHSEIIPNSASIIADLLMGSLE